MLQTERQGLRREKIRPWSIDSQNPPTFQDRKHIGRWRRSKKCVDLAKPITCVHRYPSYLRFFWNRVPLKIHEGSVKFHAVDSYFFFPLFSFSFGYCSISKEFRFSQANRLAGKLYRKIPEKGSRFSFASHLNLAISSRTMLSWILWNLRQFRC